MYMWNWVTYLFQVRSTKKLRVLSKQPQQSLPLPGPFHAIQSLSVSILSVPIPLRLAHKITSTEAMKMKRFISQLDISNKHSR